MSSSTLRRILGLLFILLSFAVEANAQPADSVVPSDATHCYVSDAYSLTIQPGNPMNYWPGVVNTQGTIGNSKTVDIWFAAGEFELNPPTQNLTLFNVDVRIGLYDATNGTPVTPLVLAKYPWNGQDALLINATAGYDRSPVGQRTLAWPLPLTIVTPATGGPFLFGPRLSFFSGLTSPMVTHYAYFAQCAWKVRP